MSSLDSLPTVDGTSLPPPITRFPTFRAISFPSSLSRPVFGPHVYASLRGKIFLDRVTMVLHVRPFFRAWRLFPIGLFFIRRPSTLHTRKQESLPNSPGELTSITETARIPPPPPFPIRSGHAGPNCFTRYYPRYSVSVFFPFFLP